jgi:hypothetical protein
MPVIVRGQEGRGQGRETDGDDRQTQIEVVTREDDGLERHSSRETTVGGVVEESAHEEEVLEERVQDEFRRANVVQSPVLQQERSKEAREWVKVSGREDERVEEERGRREG